jgi:hypothetical protein
VLGEARFHNLITDYLLAHPSSSPSLRWVGRELPAFLGAHAYGAEVPWLEDLARFEWTRNDVFQAENSPVLGLADLSAIPAEEWADLRFTPVPASALLRLGWDVASVFERLDEGEEAGEAARDEHMLLVRREGYIPVHERLDDAEAAALARVFGRATFAEVCETLATDGDAEAAASRAAVLLGRWLGMGLLAGARTS